MIKHASFLLCAILANDQETAISLAPLVADERLVWDGFEDHHDIFGRHLAAVLRGEAASIGVEDCKGARGSKSFWINPISRTTGCVRAGRPSGDFGGEIRV